MNELGMAFRHAYRSLRSLSGRETHGKRGELGHAQYVLLGELLEQGPLAARDLASAAALSPGAVSQMLDHLAAAGHVERVRSETDRRIVVSELTPSGRKEIEARRAHWGERWEQALEGVSAEDLRTAAKVLERIGTVFADPGSA